jgi:hypothetical protein
MPSKISSKMISVPAQHAMNAGQISPAWSPPEKTLRASSAVLLVRNAVRTAMMPSLHFTVPSRGLTSPQDAVPAIQPLSALYQTLSSSFSGYSFPVRGLDTNLDLGRSHQLEPDPRIPPINPGVEDDNGIAIQGWPQSSSREGVLSPGKGPHRPRQRSARHSSSQPRCMPLFQPAGSWTANCLVRSSRGRVEPSLGRQ